MTRQPFGGIPMERFNARLWRLERGSRKPQKTSSILLAERLLEKPYARTRSRPQIRKSSTQIRPLAPHFLYFTRRSPPSCKNARRISPGVNRTRPSPGTFSRKRAFRVECFVNASPLEFGKSSGLWAQDFRKNRLCSGRSKRFRHLSQ
jgi:hypothetical protein